MGWIKYWETKNVYICKPKTCLMPNSKKLHIVCFDIPYPTVYGGVIDVFYRIKALHEAGVAVTLHCTHKGPLVHYRELECLCEKVYYYPRHVSLRDIFGNRPITVAGRPNGDVLKNLMRDDSPILYEGLVSCGTIDAEELRGRKKYFRECNIEHDYYNALAKATRWGKKRLYYIAEARKLKRFEDVIGNATAIFALARHDEEHFRERFPETETVYVPCFHKNERVTCMEGRGNEILYHGNLDVAENRMAAMFIIKEIAPCLPQYRFVIAGKYQGGDLVREADRAGNVTLRTNLSEGQMEELTHNAQIQLLITFQATGMKLKLLNSLFEGRHVVCNQNMVHGTELGALCHIANDAETIVEMCKRLHEQPFSEREIEERGKTLRNFDNRMLAERMIGCIFGAK